MSTTPTAQDARQSLLEHVSAKGIEVFLKYGPQIGWEELQRLLLDRAYVRYPCELCFDAAPLEAGEFAHPVPRGANPEAGFTLYVHPAYRAHLAEVPPLALYQLVAVNYGEFASADEAESFGAAALGLTRDEYYAMLCGLADRVDPAIGAAPPPAGGSGP
jgi:hypothetical protein